MLPIPVGMNRAVLGGGAGLGDDTNEAELRLLKLVNLTLDWELRALALDARRYCTQSAQERESLRESAAAYRKCAAELTEMLSASALLACKL